MSEPVSSALKLWVVMNRAVQSIERHLRRQVEAHGLGFTEFAVLEVLYHKGAQPIGEIGSRILLTSGSMTYVIDKLEQRGLLRRAPSATDRRRVTRPVASEVPGKRFETVRDEVRGPDLNGSHAGRQMADKR